VAFLTFSVDLCTHFANMSVNNSTTVSVICLHRMRRIATDRECMESQTHEYLPIHIIICTQLTAQHCGRPSSNYSRLQLPATMRLQARHYRIRNPTVL